ncbi:hypothetical protein PMAYCL1PPCAC_21973, partial [Pristionchus mayeri]
QIGKPLFEISDNTLARYTAWSDPQNELQGFAENKLRCNSRYFGVDAVAATLKNLGLELLIRAHQIMQNGYEFFGRKNPQCISVFTAGRHNTGDNFGMSVHISRSFLATFLGCAEFPDTPSKERFLALHEKHNRTYNFTTRNVQEERNDMTIMELRQ